MLKKRIQDDMKSAMKSREKRKLGVIRLILAAIKQVEVDERKEPDDTRILAVLDKMVKQRHDSISQYEKAGRADLVDQESFEIDVINTYLPEALGDDEIAALIDDAVGETGARSMREMGAVMQLLRPKMQGRADMAKVSALVKQRLSG